MVLEAITKNIQDILSAQKRYLIPRYQREYSWGRDELIQLWDDIWSSINFIDGVYSVGEYFIGSVVLSGNDQSEELEIVDGQQRLTTLTILLSALRAVFENCELDNIAEGTYAYIQGKDKDGEKFFKIVNPMVQPYFNDSILFEKPVDAAPKNDEERRLKYAYDFFINKFKPASIEESAKVNKKWSDASGYQDLLKAVRNQLLGFKLIYITVSEKKYANTIFETLNAKGKELTPVDLIKNEIFGILESEHPSDDARNKWISIKEKLNSRSRGTSVPDYFRYYWISKHKYIAKNKIYSEFSDAVANNKINPESYLTDIERVSDFYVKMYSPGVDDWPELENKFIFETLKAFNTFNVKSPRIFLMSLFDKSAIKHRQKKDILLFLQDFHFSFTAISSSKASGIDRKYSKYAILLRKASSDVQISTVLNEMKTDFTKMLPSKETFISGVDRLFFKKKQDKHKGVVKYILNRYERILMGSDEFEISNMSIEHVSDESFGVVECGKVGNLLPLSKEINEQLSTVKDFSEKLKVYQQSNYFSVKKFCKDNELGTTYASTEIDRRTEVIANELYSSLFRY